MSIIYLIRHGQASFGGGDYDRLSDLGILQARLIGESLNKDDSGPCAVFSGRLRRQIETGRHALGLMEFPPEIQASSAFDELDADDLIRVYLPIAAAQQADIRAFGSDFRRDRRQYMQVLLAVLKLWMAGTEGAVAESYAAFCRRVGAGIRLAVNGRGRGDRVAIFTSGGVIAMVLGEALGLSHDKIGALIGQINNASISELLYEQSGILLRRFNSVGHLDVGGQGPLITYL